MNGASRWLEACTATAAKPVAIAAASGSHCRKCRMGVMCLVLQSFASGPLTRGRTRAPRWPEGLAVSRWCYAAVRGLDAGAQAPHRSAALARGADARVELLAQLAPHLGRVVAALLVGRGRHER